MADLPCQCQCGLVVDLCLVHAALLKLDIAHADQRGAFQRRLAALTGQGQCLRLNPPRRANLPGTRHQRAQADADLDLANATRPRREVAQRPLVAGTRLGLPTSGLQRRAQRRLRLRRVGAGQTGHAAHRLRQVHAGLVRPLQRQRCPGTHQRAAGQRRRVGQDCAAACGDEVVQLDAPVFDRPLRAECRKPGAVAGLRRQQGRRAAAGVAAVAAQVFVGVGLHAHQQVETFVFQSPHEGFVDQRMHCVHGPGRMAQVLQSDHTLGRFKREAALEHRQLRERGLVGRGQQVPRPVERGAQCGLAVQPVAGRGQQLEALAHARQHCPRRQAAHPGSGQLDRQRQAVEQAHQRGNCRVIVRAGIEVAFGSGRAAAEQRFGVGRQHWRQRHRLFAGNAQHLARGDQKARLGCTFQPAAQGGLGVAGDLLEIVQDHQAGAAPGDGVAQLGQRVVFAQRHVQALGHGVQQAVGLARRGQVAKPHAARKVTQVGPAEVGGEPGLAAAAYAQQRHQPRARVKAPGQVAQGGAAADKGVALGWQAVADRSHRQPEGVLGVAIERLSRTSRPSRRMGDHAVGFVAVRRRGKRGMCRAGLAHLVQRHRLGHALEAPMAVGEQPVHGGVERADGLQRAGREQGLAAQGGGHDARGQQLGHAVHLQRLGAQGHVTGRGFAQADRADVQATARQHRRGQAGQRAVVGQGIGQRITGLVEQQQKAVGLVDLAPAPVAQQVTRQAVVAGPERGHQAVAQARGQCGAVHQVGQQQGQGRVHRSSIEENAKNDQTM